MIDVDERGRAAAADLNRAAAAVATTHAALDAVLAGRALVEVGPRRPRRGRRLAAAFAVAAAVVVAIVGTLAVRGGGSDRVSVVSATPVSTAGLPSSVPDPSPVSTTGSPQTTGPVSTQVAQTAAPGPSGGLRSAALHEVADADRLPPLVMAATAGAYVDERFVQAGSYDLAVQAPGVPVMLGPAGGGPPRAAGDPPVDLWGFVSWIGTPVLGDVAIIDGEPRVAFTISCGAGPLCRNEVHLKRITDPTDVAVHVISATGPDRELPVAFGRMSASDTGVVVGVATWDDGRLVHPVVILPAPSDPDQEPSGLHALMELLGLDVNTYDVGDPQRPLAITVDQSGRVVAWITTAEVHLVDITTGERRTIPLARRPEAPLPVLDVALSGSGLTAGAVLISAPGQPAYVLDLADGSLTQIPDFLGTVTFGAVRP
jgi:hypothetical protein